MDRFPELLFKLVVISPFGYYLIHAAEKSNVHIASPGRP